MNIKLKTLAVAVGSTLALGLATQASAQISVDTIKIGFITDMSSLYAADEGKTGATAIQTSIDDFRGKVNTPPN